MLIEIQKATGALVRGTWKHWQYLAPNADAYRWTATICCPDCGKFLNLVNHTIAADGQVSPSVGHPDGYPACNWHTHPRLIGWEQLAAQPLPPAPPPETCQNCGTVSRVLGGWGTWSGGAGLICADCIRIRKL